MEKRVAVVVCVAMMFFGAYLGVRSRSSGSRFENLWTAASTENSELASIDVKKTYYVNLESSRSRRIEMEAQLERARRSGGIPYERIPALRGASVADLSGEIGRVMVERLGCGDRCHDALSPGLCCLAALGDRGASAARALQDDTFLCAHQTAHDVGVSSSSHEACFHMIANWASHVRALERARDEFFEGAHPDDHVLVLEDDAMITADWYLRLKTTARLASSTSDNVLEALLGTVASNPKQWDFIRADLDAFDVSTFFFDLVADPTPPPTPQAYEENPLFSPVDWATVPSFGTFAWGAGALLVRVASIDKLLAAASTCIDIDWALNIGTAKGIVNMATFAVPLFIQNYTLGLISTIE